MTTPAKPELPEPELGYIETDKSRQPAFSARQMREALQSAQPAAPQYNGWYCAHCQRGVDASEVTFHEQHTVCGRVITNDAPPALQPAAAVSDEEIDAAVLHATGFDGIGLQDMNRFDCRDIARAILALRQQAEIDVRNTPFGKEAEKLADDYMALMSECAVLRDRLAALRPQAVPMTDEQVDRIWNALPMGNGFWLSFARAVEAHHGITQRADGGVMQA